MQGGQQKNVLTVLTHCKVSFALLAYSWVSRYLIVITSLARCDVETMLVILLRR